MILTLAVLTGCLLDFLLGDPEGIPHPVVLMGACITKAERILRRIFPKSPKGELAGGCVLAAFLPTTVFLIAFVACRLCLRIHPAVYYLLESFWCYQSLAARGLAREAEGVRGALTEQGLASARKQVSRIVGRDTDGLDGAGVIRACVETVAENSSDGVAAPLLYMLIGGAPLALAYKAVNTMDSMIGYRNDRYLFFGRAAARLDDIVNFIPSRITALCWIAAAFPDPEADGKNAWRIFRRDRWNHPSPNSAQPESACAGALHIRLGGPAYYFGALHEKPPIGEDDRPVETEDIRRSVRLMWISSVLLLAAGIIVRICCIRV